MESGSYDSYLAAREQLAQLTAQQSLVSISAEDRLLVAEAEMYGDIPQGERTIRSVLKEYPTPLALAFHSQTLTKLYYDNNDPTTRDQAFDELNAAKLLMPDCAYVTLLDFWAHFPVFAEGGASSLHETRVKEAVARLAQYERYPVGHHSRACYFDFIGETENARREWKAVVSSSTAGWMHGYFAAFEYRHGNREEALEFLRSLSSQSLWAVMPYGEAMALEPDGADIAMDTYEQAAQRFDQYSIGPHDFVDVPETILLLLGDQAEASRRLALRNGSAQGPPWQMEMQKFLSDPSAQDETLLNSAKGAYSRVVAHKLIAFRHLSRGNIDLAEDHLAKCVQAFRWQPDAYWANAFLSRLRTDTAWREWLKTRHAVPGS